MRILALVDLAPVADAFIDRLRTGELFRFLPAALLLKGRALATLGKAAEAEATLQEARAEAGRLGARPILWRVDGELAA